MTATQRLEPLESHSYIKIPPDRNIRIWRYVDFAKYVDLLQRRQLYFARADLLGDPFEGSMPVPNAMARRALSVEDARRDAAAGVANPGLPVGSLISKMTRVQREWTYVNCWHMNEHESAAMWKLYAASSQAIAVQSTYAKLRDCLPGGVPNTAPWIYVGVVTYLDYESRPIAEGNTYVPFMYKRISFEHERELRALFQDDDGMHEERIMKKGEGKGPEGRRIDLDLAALVESVLVAPTAPAWFLELVQNVSARYGLNVPVKSSALDAEAMF